MTTPATPTLRPATSHTVTNNRTIIGHKPQTLGTAPPKTATVRSTWESPLGSMTLAAQGDWLVGVWFDGQKHQPDYSRWSVSHSHPVLQATVAQLGDWFAGERHTFDLPLGLDTGTAFQQTVWQALLAIAPGQTLSYGALGQAIGKPQAARAVGAAVGRNPLSIVVPCHRVVGNQGALTGYAGGLERKVALLRLEAGRHAALQTA